MISLKRAFLEISNYQENQQAVLFNVLPVGFEFFSLMVYSLRYFDLHRIIGPLANQHGVPYHWTIV